MNWVAVNSKFGMVVPFLMRLTYCLQSASKWLLISFAGKSLRVDNFLLFLSIVYHYDCHTVYESLQLGHCS